MANTITSLILLHGKLLWYKNLSRIKRQLFKAGAKGKKKSSEAGNRTPVSRVTGGDTHHYTTSDSLRGKWISIFLNLNNAFCTIIIIDSILVKLALPPEKALHKACQSTASSFCSMTQRRHLNMFQCQIKKERFSRQWNIIRWQRCQCDTATWRRRRFQVETIQTTSQWLKGLT